MSRAIRLIHEEVKLRSRPPPRVPLVACPGLPTCASAAASGHSGWASDRFAEARHVAVADPIAWGLTHLFTCEEGHWWTSHQWHPPIPIALAGTGSSPVFSLLSLPTAHCPLPASGIDREIFDGVDSFGATRLVLTGNPLRFDGPFRELHDQGVEEASLGGIPDEERVASLRVPSTDSPDADKPHSPRGLASGGWIRRMYRKHGKHSPWCRAHIDAQFPEAVNVELFPTAWLDAATNPGLIELRQSLNGGPVRLACDLGEGVGRDNSVIIARDDLGILEIWVCNVSDIDRVADEYAHMVKRWRVQEKYMSYDKMGIGKPFGNRLAGHGIHYALPYSGSAAGGREYANLRSACAWKLRQRLDPNHIIDPAQGTRRQIQFHIPAGEHWPMLREDLRALRGDSIGTKNRLETKLDLCARLGRSPDRGDALIQSFVSDVLGRGG